jgi:hypothetical protein
MRPSTAQPGLRVVNNELIRQSYERTSFLGDVYSFQISLRYNFN